jgi:hypothetical protein
MSRGHGRLQRLALGMIESADRPVYTSDIAYSAFDIGEWKRPTEAQVVSVRRALRKLAKEGHIVRMEHGQTWASERVHLRYIAGELRDPSLDELAKELGIEV